jgi:hypothetical protein
MRFTAVVLVGLVACADVTSPEEFVSLVDASRSCGSADTCVLAGSSACTCATPVNANDEAAVNEAAAQVECEGATVMDGGGCPPAHDGLRCDSGRCVSDQSP